MKRKLIYTLAALALAAALPAEATWTYINSPGKYNNQNDKSFSGVVTDSQTWTFYVLDLGDGTWQLGAGQATGTNWGVDQNFGSFLAGKSDSKTPIPYDGSNYTGTGSGVLDLSTLTKDTGLSFSAVGPRFMGGHTGVTSIILPPGVKSIGIAAFQGCTALTSFDASLTSLETIADATNPGSPFYRGALQNCTSLTNIILPATLTYVGNNAFTYLKTGSVPQIHFQGDVPTFNGNVFNGNKNSQWAFYVNALQYPNWKNAFATGLYSTDAVFPHYDGEKTSWLPSYLNDSAIYGDPSVFFGYKTGVPPFVNTSERAYLIQEGEAGETIPASATVAVSDIGRTNATFTVTVDLGTSSEAALTFTVGDHTETETVSSETTTFTYTYYDLDIGTEYSYTATVTADSGNGSTKGSATTVDPDVSLGATDYIQSNDGLSATLTVNVAQLLSGTAAIVLSRDGTEVETKTVSEAGDVTFDVLGLTLWQTYDYTFTATSSEHGDVATATLSFKAQPYHWEYTPNGGETQAYPWDGTVPQAGNQANYNGQPQNGTITDGRWVFYVYHNPEWSAGEFWLGEGNSGSTAYSQKGLPDIDLSGVYDDTGIKLVGIGGYAFAQKSADITSIVFPKFITHIGKQAFYKCENLKAIDLGHTSLTNVLEMGLQNCLSLTNIVFPATLETLGGTALAWGPAKRAIHFLGDVPVCETSVSSGTAGTDQAIYSGADNRQWAYCVDAEKYPSWKTVATTTLYTTENPFPSNEAEWMAEHVRKGQPYANGKKTYGYPFGNSTLGRGYDKSNTGRAYLIQETQIEPGFAINIR